MHPAVLEATVIDVPDERAGEAVVVHQDPALSEADQMTHCKLHLSGCKVPRIVEFRSKPLQKSNIGKTLRRALRHAAPIQAGSPAPA
jgi:long-chain acyl-CoA synthetase